MVRESVEVMVERYRVLKLIIEDDEGRKTVVPFTRDEITIGRQEGNTIRLTERNVSRRHARLMRNNGHVLIEDLGSYNGIRINGDRISGQVQVADGDLIQIGDYDLALQKEELAGATVPLDAGPPPAAPTRKMPDTSLPTMPALPAIEEPDEGEVGKDAPPPIPRHQATSVIRLDSLEANRKRTVQNIDAAEAPRLVVLNTELAGREFKCTRTELKIGRVDENDIVIDHRSLSRTHCKVVREESGEWRIIDMQSANGLMVNGESYAQVTLRPGDVIELGHVKLKFAAAGDEVDVPAASASPSGEGLAPASASKTPLIAMGIAILVLLVGGGGWLAVRSNEAVGKRPEPAKPPTPQETAAEKKAAALKAAQAKVDEAKAAAAQLDFAGAEAALSEAKVGGEMLDDAKDVLALLAAEKDKRTALETAAKLLDGNTPEKAKVPLEQAAGTRLMADRYAELSARLEKAVAAKSVPKNDPAPKPEPRNEPAPKPEPKNDPEPRTVAAATPKNTEAEALVTEGTAEMKAGNLERAAIRVEKCIKVAPTYPACYKLGGSVYARISQRDQSLSDQAKAKKYYQRFVELAPPDDPAVPKVKKLLEDAQ